MASVWTETCKIKEREPLKRDISTEVAVIGAGIVGVLISSELQKGGLKTVVLEADRIASGQTRNTTAKITSQHGMNYAKLCKTLGKTNACQYAKANEAAIEKYREIINAENIDCNFEEQSAYVYGYDIQALENEAKCASDLGITCDIVSETDLPFSVIGALRFDGQAQFHPLKLIKALSEPLTIYEKTPAIKVEGNKVITDRGIVTAEHIVFACHYPFVNFPGLYFARMHQERSYVLALENTGSDLNGMWIGAGDDSFSFRRYGELLLLGGGGHRTGENKQGGKYDMLREKARKWYPDSREVGCWSAQDCVTSDCVPYIGRYAKSEPSWYIATGFKKWGMTSAMVSAMIISDLIQGKKNEFADVFDPQRLNLIDIAGVAGEVGHSVKGLAKGLVTRPSQTLNTHCPHLGCQLEINRDENSWDCPCHGSRFTLDGELISGPAQINLKHIR